MLRIARTVIADIPHHMAQRGNRRDSVFFNDEDRKEYLKRLTEYCHKYKVKVLAYCLMTNRFMTNHVHLIVVPEQPESLQRTLKPLHMRYAQYINRQHK